jgi:hypothetical protein
MMRTTLIALSCLTVAVIFTLAPVGPLPALGETEDHGNRDSKLQGTWNVILKFPVCNAVCTCPGGTPNIPVPALNTYLKDNMLLVSHGGSLFAGPGQGSWDRITHNQYKARFKFFLFNASGARVGSEEVTKTIGLTGPDAFQATSSFDFFDAAGNLTAHACPINETGTRFE